VHARLLMHRLCVLTSFSHVKVSSRSVGTMFSEGFIPASHAVQVLQVFSAANQKPFVNKGLCIRKSVKANFKNGESQRIA